MLESQKVIAQQSILDPAIQSSPYELYRALHESAPVFHVPETGVYVISRYEDVRAVLLNPGDFSNKFGSDSFLELQGKEGSELYTRVLRERGGWQHLLSLQNSDPPLHTKHRKLLDASFNKASIKKQEPEIARICAELIDSFIAAGECEFVDQFALPLPGKISARMIGLDPKELPTFKRWAEAIVKPITHVMSRPEIIENAETEVELQMFLARKYEERRANPADDVITVLATQPASDGKLVSMEEYQYIMRQLVAAGFDTTMNALSHCMWLLTRYPREARRIAADPTLIPKFIEEALRFESPVQGLYRRAVRDVEIAGVQIPAQSVLMVRYGAANRDARQFPGAEQFDIDRPNAASHLGFGNGIHFCLGRILARQELMIALTQLVQRMEDFALSRPLPQPAHHSNLVLHPLKELPITFRAVGRA